MAVAQTSALQGHRTPFLMKTTIRLKVSICLPGSRSSPSRRYSNSQTAYRQQPAQNPNYNHQARPAGSHVSGVNPNPGVQAPQQTFNRGQQAPIYAGQYPHPQQTQYVGTSSMTGGNRIPTQNTAPRKSSGGVLPFGAGLAVGGIAGNRLAGNSMAA